MSRWGEAPWSIDLQPSPASPPERCEIAVVGGGLTGLAAALALAERGVDVALLEADRIGAGASGRSGGIVLAGAASGPLPPCDEGDPDSCLEALQRRISDPKIECGLELGGCLELEHRRRGRGGALWHDGESDLHVDTGVPGGTLDPGALIAGLARAARRAGARLCEGARVTQIGAGGKPLLAPDGRAASRARPSRSACRSGDPVLALDDRTLRPRRVLLAQNAYSAELAPAPIRNALTLALCTAPLGGAAEKAVAPLGGRPFYTVDLPYVWGRALPDGRFIFGGGLVFEPRGDLKRIELGHGEAAAALQRLEDRVRGFHPGLSRLRVERRWGGPLALLPGRPPLLAPHPAHSAVWIAGGYTGHGLALSVYLGDLAARVLAEEDEPPPWGAFEP